ALAHPRRHRDQARAGSEKGARSVSGSRIPPPGLLHRRARRSAAWLVLVSGWALLVMAVGVGRAQSQAAPTSTPRTAVASDPSALAEGQALFRGLCSGCHGGAGRGGKGPDLTDQRWIHGSTDDDIERVIKKGVAATTMKQLGESLKDEQI